MSQPPQATARRGGWGAVICALLILAVVGIVVAWLRYTGELAPMLSATPRIEIELPPLDEIPLETVEEPAPPSSTAADMPAGDDSAAKPDPPTVSNAVPDPLPDPTPAEPAEEPVVIPAAPTAPTTEETEAEPVEPPPEPTATEHEAELGPFPVWTPPEPAEPPVAVEAESDGGIEHASAEETSADRQEQVAATAVTGAALPTWKRFARPFEAAAGRPRIAVIVAELGVAEAATRATIRQLPAEVTLSFSPYSQRLQYWIDTARADGHEVMLDIPMEPVSFPRDDPGPKALFTSLSEAENLARLADILDQAEGYVGVVPWMGSRFTMSAEDLHPVLEVLAKRGLMFVDARAAPDSIAAQIASEADVPRAINDRFLDHEASRVAIDGRLQQIERQARATGFAVAMASPYPVTIERLDQWVRTLDRKGLVLAPISALADRQEDR